MSAAETTSRTTIFKHGVSWGEAFRVWLRVAALSFGGPAGPDRGHASHPGGGEALDLRNRVSCMR